MAFMYRDVFLDYVKGGDKEQPWSALTKVVLARAHAAPPQFRNLPLVHPKLLQRSVVPAQYNNHQYLLNQLLQQLISWQKPSHITSVCSLIIVCPGAGRLPPVVQHRRVRQG